jgi:prophage maintenance system killer protein
VATDVFLRINGYKLKRSPSQIYSKMIGMLEKRHFTKDPIDEWLRSFVVSANQ